MELILNILKSLVYGIIQGITEWIPVSSTAHLTLMRTFMPLQIFADSAANQAFWDLYKVVIQFGSILAVVLLFWNKLNPFNPKLKPNGKKRRYRLWLMILIASMPAGIAGVLLNDLIDSRLSSPLIIALTLILYGLLFIWMEMQQRKYTVESVGQITVGKAAGVGLFQMLALIPGTSRSGSTILGATLLGFDRPTAVEFSFFMAIPVMFGASLLKIVKFVVKGGVMSFSGFIVLLAGMVSAFVISLIFIRKILDYIRKHDFTVFGIYRIILGMVIGLFALTGIIR